MTQVWTIALVLLGCPVALGLLLAVLSTLEDGLSAAAKAPAKASQQVPAASRADAPGLAVAEAARL